MAGLFTPDIYYFGPDGIGDPQCLKDSGSMATSNMFATQGVADATQNPDAKAVVDAYSAAYPGSSNVGAYTFAGYDCAALLIDAIGRAIDANGGNKPTRAQVNTALSETSSVQGLTRAIALPDDGHAPPP